MTYQGTVKQGIIILDPSASLPDGARVRVEPINDQSSLVKPHFRAVGSWDGPPGELDQLLAEVQQLRDSDYDALST